MLRNIFCAGKISHLGFFKSVSVSLCGILHLERFRVNILALIIHILTVDYSTSLNLGAKIDIS